VAPGCTRSACCFATEAGKRTFVAMTIEHEAGLASAIAAVRRVLDETEQEYRQMPFFVRPMVRRGFAKRTGHDFASWRALLDEAVQGRSPAALVPALAALAEHYRGAPARAKLS